MNNTHQHFLSFDVEHWYESYRHRNLPGWEKIPPRDHIVVEQLFKLLSQYGHTATFFFTGRFAREFPALVSECIKLGHEVASHSDEHCVINRMASKLAFSEDLKRSLDTLKAITGKSVLGYRAPKWSITKENQSWVFNILADFGLKYDSSFFPTLGCDEHRGQGLPLQIELPDGRSMIEVPATGFNLGSAVLPVAGGFYFRAFPAWLASAMLVQKERRGINGMLYLHPYDLDVKSPKISGGSLLFKLFRIYGVAGAWKKLEFLLSKHQFISIEKGLASLTFASKIDLRTNYE